jgi:osmotically-inducible protein OsmY
MTGDGLYLAQHIKDALANDPEVGELGVEVTVEANTVILAGPVTTEQRRSAAYRVVRKMAPDAEVVERLDVVSGTRDQPETLH